MTDSSKIHRLVRLSTAIVIGDWDCVRELRRSAAPGEPDREWREAILQTHLFAGFPRLVQAFGVLEEEGGIGVPAAQEVESPMLDPGRGAQLFDDIYGKGADTVRELLDGYHKDFGAWIAEHAYGRVLARPGLQADRRELLAACALAALGQDRQLASHCRGALRCGATLEELEAAFDSAADLIPADNLVRARRIARSFQLES
mgnify:CR=1 FL=1